MEHNNKYCQSCAMPMSKCPNGGGTNTDGSKNKLYCSYCYANGDFTAPDMTVSQMQSLVKGELKKMGFFMSLFANYYSKKIPKLKRWSNQ